MGKDEGPASETTMEAGKVVVHLRQVVGSRENATYVVNGSWGRGGGGWRVKGEEGRGSSFE